MSREEWRAYVESLNIQDTFPGIQGVGYSEIVHPEDLDVYIEGVQDEGFSEFTVHPEGEREIYTSIIYLEPFDVRNQEAFGFDMFQEPTRRKAMEFARDTDTAALSGRVTLVQEIDADVQAGFLIYLPLYAKDIPHATLGERRGSILGYIYSPFRMNNFMEDIFSAEQSGLDLEIYDGSNQNFLPENEMYRTAIVDAEASILRAVRTLEIGGHAWTVRYTAGTGYGFDFFRTSLPFIVLGSGILFSILLFFITYVLNTRREKAALLAAQITNDLNRRTEENEKIAQELEKVNEDLKKQSAILEQKVDEVERINEHLVGREIKMVELKEKLKKEGKDTET
ncbi:CHASE domain-containing protein [Candidatus Kaiserbacteria bacterium]|nr:CHASE domain-containing protein [Candidatus Kaiserbacteria bacterium]